MSIFGFRNRGMRCESTDPTGNTHVCKPYEADKNEKLATGSEVTITVSSETGCKPIFNGSYDVLVSDEKAINKLIEKKVLACRKGLA